MANKKISELTEKTTFGDDDFLAGTQGAGATDNRKYGKAAIQAAVGGGFVPLSGTEVGSPVTGDIVSDAKMIFKDLDNNYNTYFGYLESQDWTGLIREGGDGSYSAFLPSSSPIMLRISPFGERNQILIEDNAIYIDTTTESTFKGLVGSFYYGENYNDNTYVQKKYVDDNFVPKAPNDGNAYVMKNGAWVDINSL